MPQGGLFSQYFLTDGVTASLGWPSIADARLTQARTEIAALLADFTSRHEPQEAETERDLIDKALACLGWGDFLVQIKATSKGRSDVPDYLLFTDPAAKQAATALPPAERYALGASIVEAKAWDVSLDKGGNEIGEGAPSTQILRYLGAVDVRSEGAIRFGILTNGRFWRLYDNKARSRLEGFVEIDLMEAAGLIVPAERPTEGEAGQAYADHVLRLFLWLFGRDAFVADAGGTTRLIQAIRESRNFEARVTDHLAETVFDTVFPDLANALWRADPDGPDHPDLAYRAELREAALTWLYRLLFVLYAEDRSLLPTRNRRDGLWATRKEAAHAIDADAGLSKRRSNFDGDLRALWRQIDSGDEAIGLPPYNGGLFKAERSPLLERAVMADADFAPLLDALSRERIGTSPRFINYRDLSVQHLGSVYERLLEFDLGVDGSLIVAQPQTFARKASGSYYTPEELVMLVILRTIGPLLDERRQTFRDASGRLKSETRKKAERTKELAAFDPAGKFLELRICDPAMGSGHFLVSLVDYLADEVLKATEEARETADWTDYSSPLLGRLETIRQRIRGEAAAHGWAVDEAQLVDRQLVRRIILKRVIHGVDKNPMAVELAKLSLWLHTFTVGAPLSFLDHHLRCGDSLFGEWVRPIEDMLFKRGIMFLHPPLAAARGAVTGMAAIEDATDADIVEVRHSEETFEAVLEETRPLSAFMAYVQGWRWIADRTDWRTKAVFDQFLLASFGDPVELARGAVEPREPLGFDFAARVKRGRIGRQLSPVDGFALFTSLHAQVRKLAADERFFAWQAEFPGIWTNWTSAAPNGGFDALIGNPPWAKVELEAQKWFAGRNEAVVAASTNTDRERLIDQLRTTDPALYENYNSAKAKFSTAVEVARDGGNYPLFSSGRPNLYQLFYEQALRLVAPCGVIGFLVPSGIIADRGASAFVRHVAPPGRILTFFDFENRRPGSAPRFFAEVDSRFKLAVTVIGGAKRVANCIDCAFFLPTTKMDEIRQRIIRVEPTEFELLNPNTGTAIIFRDVEDAAITRRLYNVRPLLHRDGAAQIWPVRYSQMLNQATDSGLFHDVRWLEARNWYPVALNRWAKGDAAAFPLYEGKMVQAFDHRAADIIVNPANRRRPGQPRSLTSEDHRNIDRYPSPQHFIERTDIPIPSRRDWLIAFKDVTAVTNIRTMIAMILPACGAVHALPVLLPTETDEDYAMAAPAIVGNLNSFVFDYCARQKVQAQHLSWYIVEQLPVVQLDGYDRRFGVMTARDIVAREVLHLTYTAHDMAPFARDMGHVDEEGMVLAPFAWDEADRRQRRARLDALYFHLYGISREDADYILSTFPIVRRHDEAAFDGRFVTRDLILAQMAALEAGDPDAVIVLH